VITKDNVPVRVNAVAYFRIVDPKSAIVQIENYMVATSQIAQTTLRSVLGQHVLDELLSEREKINSILQGSSTRRLRRGASRSRSSRSRTSRSRAACSARWRARPRPSASGAQDHQLEGEFQAAERLKDAAAVIERAADRAAAPLSADAARARRSQSTTIVFPAPIDLIRPFLDKFDSSS
jgi:regulator of protease activity HflC (stomatin/prohibitin superfamily)